MNEVIEQAAVAVAAVLDQSAWTLTSTDIVTRLSGLEDIATSIRVAQASLVHELAGRDWARSHGSTSTTNFLRDHLRISGTAAERLVKLGAILDRRAAMTPAMSRGSRAEALSGPLGVLATEAATAAPVPSDNDAGQGDRLDAPGAAEPSDDDASPADAIDGPEPGDHLDQSNTDDSSPTEPIVGIAVNPEQALIIGNIVRNLPGDLPTNVVNTCEAELIKLAAVYEPGLLRTLGEKILNYIAPEIAEEALAAKLDKEEAAARRKRAFTIRDDGNGSHSIYGRLDTESAAILKAAIEPLSKPIPSSSGAGERDPRLAEQRRADALIDVCRLALTTDTLPDNGGQRPQLNVTVKYDVLTKELSAGSLDIGGQLSPTTVRRLACDALILPAVLGSRGEVLDLGRQRRLFTGAVRRAIILRDGGCAFPGCDRPPTWCQVHHWIPWHKGGTTRALDGILLCGHHHNVIHLPGGWRIIRDTDGLFSFIPPPYVDPDQRPQRNKYHRKT